jgi:hypothetical protein
MLPCPIQGDRITGRKDESINLPCVSLLLLFKRLIKVGLVEVKIEIPYLQFRKERIEGYTIAGVYNIYN